MRVLIGCVAENNDRLLAQALRLVLSLRWFGGSLAEADVIVGVVEGVDEGYAAELRALGAVVRRMERVDPRFPPGNKLNLFAQPEVDDYEVVFYLDCDTLIVQDPAPYLSTTELRAKITDAPTVPLATFERLCQHFGLPAPVALYTTTSTGDLTCWYCNSGVINMPVRLIDEIVPLWRHYQGTLSAHPEYFQPQIHCGQAGLALAYFTRPVPFTAWPVSMNYPLHLTEHAPPDMLAAEPVILHYHDRVKADGTLQASPYRPAQAHIEQFNRRLRERMAGGWRFPLVKPSAPSAPVAVSASAEEPATGTVLVAAGADPLRLRQKLEGIYGPGQSNAPRVVLVGASAYRGGAQAVAEGLGLAAPFVLIEPGGMGMQALRRQVQTPRIGFLEAGADYAPPAWAAVPHTGEALLPWLPPVPRLPDNLRLPVERACGWLAPAKFLERLEAATSLDDWALWKLADEGLAGLKLDWLALPAEDPLPSAPRARRHPGSLTRSASVLAVVPNYKTEAYLDQCLLSLVRQTRPPDGIVVLDDGSAVPPVEIVGRYPGVSLLRVRQNAGQFRNMQSIFDSTAYDAYLFQDADDWSAINRLELLLAEAERTGADWVGCAEARLLYDDRRLGPTSAPLDVNLAAQLKVMGLPLMICTSLISRALLRRIDGLATGLPLTQDTEMLRRAVYAGRVVNAPYYAYFRRKRPDSVTMSPETNAESPARLAALGVSRERALRNKALVARGAAPELQPPRLAAHVLLEPVLGPALRPAPGASAGTLPAQPVCIAGMHRSGTSMVARMLNLCGLYLGSDGDLPLPGHDNVEGYWEHQDFVRISEAVLDRLGAAWDIPPSPADAAALAGAATLAPEHAAAATLVAAQTQQAWWGWKDPRGSLTLPFWRALVPGLRVVICVRHPLEVAASLHRRGASSTAFALRLWTAYYECLLASAPPDRRVITHYDSYFADARAEAQRVLAALNVPVPETVIERAVRSFAPRLRHHTEPDGPLPEHIAGLYARLCAEAGPVFQQAQARPRPTAFPAAADITAQAVSTQPSADHSDSLESEAIRQAYARQATVVEQLQSGLAERDRQLAAAQREAQAASQEVSALRRAKLVRAAYGYWALHARLRQLWARLVGRQQDERRSNG